MSRKRGQDKTRGFTLEKLRKVVSPKVFENAGELVDSEFAIKRFKEGNEIFTTFYFMGEQVNCSVIARKHSLHESCSCGAPYFCRHCAALVLTFLKCPDTFLDLEEFLDGLSRLPREDLADMVRTMVSGYPAAALEALGFPGFQPSEVLDEYDEDMFPGEFDDSFPGDFDDEGDWDAELEFDDDDPGHGNQMN